MKHLVLTALLLTSSVFARDPSEFNQLGSDTNFDITLYEEMHGRKQGNNLPLGPVANRGNGVFIPFELNKTDVLKIVAASSVAVVFFANDAEIMDFAQKNDAEFVDKLAYVGEAFGSEWGIALTGAGYVLGVVMDNNEVKRVAIMATKAMIVSGLATQALKFTFDRTRPRNTDNPYLTGEGSHSFPSGHTTQAFALATVIAEATKDQGIVVPILAYSAAAIAGWSRVHDRAHWASDVVIGGLIGHLTAKAVMNSEFIEKGIMIVPEVDIYGSAGFRITYTGKPDKFKCGEGLEDAEAFRDCIKKSFRVKQSVRF